jgi:hypothetical protein
MQQIMEAAMSAEPGTHPHHPIVEATLAAIADWVNRCRQLTLPSALGECDSKEVARIAADLGVTAGELRSLAEAKPGSAELLGHMLPALGIDPKALANTDPLVMRDLQRLCVTCQNKTRCRHELEETSAAGHYHEFCPNAVTLDALLAERNN